MANYNGSTIGKINEPVNEIASGTYNLREQCLYQREIIWPGSNYLRSGLALRVDANDTSSYGGSGTTWLDISGNGRNLSLVNGVSFNPAGYFDFDGVNDYAVTSNCGIGTGNSAHTLEMWVNADSWTNNNRRWWLAVIGQYNTGAHHWIGQSTTATAFGVWAGSQTSPTLQATGNWQQIVGTHDGTTLKYYVNASQSGSTVTASFNFTNANLNIGKRINNLEDYYNGKISVISVYNRALSAAEVTQNYNAIKGRYGL